MYRFFKRLFDIIFAAIAILILSPLFVPIMVVLLFTGEHYIFYFQKRIGLQNKPFLIWKFATMLKDSPNLGTGTITTRNDPRVLPIGSFLRRTKINELPQLFNVLLGSMSFVGPRPLTQNHFNKYSDDVKSALYGTKPGITGVGSIIFRDEEFLISQTTMPVDQYYQKHISPYKGELEIWYTKNRSLLVDAKIVILTAIVVVKKESTLSYKWLKNLPTKPSFKF